MKEPKETVNESKNHPKATKRNKQVIPAIPVKGDDEDKQRSVTTKTIERDESRRFI